MEDCNGFLGVLVRDVGMGWDGLVSGMWYGIAGTCVL